MIPPYLFSISLYFHYRIKALFQQYTNETKPVNYDDRSALKESFTVRLVPIRRISIHINEVKHD